MLVVDIFFETDLNISTAAAIILLSILTNAQKIMQIYNSEKYYYSFIFNNILLNFNTLYFSVLLNDLKIFHDVYLIWLHMRYGTCMVLMRDYFHIVEFVIFVYLKIYLNPFSMHFLNRLVFPFLYGKIRSRFLRHPITFNCLVKNMTTSIKKLKCIPQVFL